MNVASKPAPAHHAWSEAEWQVRCDLAALYRDDLAFRALVDFVAGGIFAHDTTFL